MYKFSKIKIVVIPYFENQLKIIKTKEYEMFYQGNEAEYAAREYKNRFHILMEEPEYISFRRQDVVKDLNIGPGIDSNAALISLYNEQTHNDVKTTDLK